MKIESKPPDAPAEELKRRIRMTAANAADVSPAPPAAKRRCRFARDTGERAFALLPCRGNRIECLKTGISSYTAACRRDKCKYYEEADRHEELLLQP